MKVGDLLTFRTGKMGAIIDVQPDFGGYALVWVFGEVTFRNPTHMNLESLSRSAKVITLDEV
tara:strand:- start:2093 stop:2278 length:186 start_codon:yes stop_codon:yes gene_type:complete